MTPQLRFPEFTDEWQVKKLGDYIKSFDAGVSVNSDDNQAGGGELAILKTSCVTRGIFDYRENKRVVELRETKRLKEPVTIDTIIISRMNTPELVGANAYVDQSYDSIYLPDRLWATKMYENCSTRFIAYKLGSKQYRQKLSSIATGTSKSMKNISKESVRQLEIVAPSKPEQEKIADFLTAVDERIAVGEKKLELLEAYKRGVMQKIFSQQIRFKDENGSPYPDWEEKKAGALFRNISNRKHNGELPVLSITQDEGVVQRDSLERKINQSDTGVKNYKIIEPNDFVISLRSFQGGIEMSNILGISSPAYTVLRGNSEVIPGMFKHYFKRDEFISKLNSTVIGIRDGKQISYEPFSTIRLPVPCIEEQQKIANFLTALDDKITAEKSKLTAARQFKKALLQRMFV